MSDPKKLLSQVRGSEPLDGLCQNKMITPDACDWIKFASDPFHDLQLDNLKGYPDLASEPTVVVKIRQAITISAPTGLPAGTTWDAHVMLGPVDWNKPPKRTIAFPGEYVAGRYNTGYNSSGTHANSAGDFVAGAPVYETTPRLDGLVINSVPSGERTYVPGSMPNVAALGYDSKQINLDDYLEFGNSELGAYRLLYSGFEAVNTTAQIYKQGAVTVYEYGNSYEPSQTVPCNDSGRYAGPVGTPTPTDVNLYPQIQSTTAFRAPPSTIAEAKIMPASHSWAAQDGTYNTQKFQTENPFQTATRRNHIFAQNDDDEDTSDSFASVGHYERQIGPLGTEVSSWLPARTHFSRMNTSGAYFTGLSEQTTLFITWRVGIERLPAAFKPTFLALATPSASYDPQAIALYNLIMNELPPGVPQGFNDAGKWYQMIKASARNAIPKAYAIIPAVQAMLNVAGYPLLAKGLDIVKQTAPKPKQNGNGNGNGNGNAKKKKAVPNFGVDGGNKRNGLT